MDSLREQVFFMSEDMSNDDNTPLNMVWAQLDVADRHNTKIKRMEVKWEEKAEKKKEQEGRKKARKIMAQELVEVVQAEEKREKCKKVWKAVPVATVTQKQPERVARHVL